MVHIRTMREYCGTRIISPIEGGFSLSNKHAKKTTATAMAPITCRIGKRTARKYKCGAERPRFMLELAANTDRLAYRTRHAAESMTATGYHRLLLSPNQPFPTQICLVLITPTAESDRNTAAPETDHPSKYRNVRRHKSTEILSSSPSWKIGSNSLVVVRQR